MVLSPWRTIEVICSLWGQQFRIMKLVLWWSSRKNEPSLGSRQSSWLLRSTCCRGMGLSYSKWALAWCHRRSFQWRKLIRRQPLPPPSTSRQQTAKRESTSKCLCRWGCCPYPIHSTTPTGSFLSQPSPKQSWLKHSGRGCRGFAHLGHLEQIWHGLSLAGRNSLRN